MASSSQPSQAPKPKLPGRSKKLLALAFSLCLLLAVYLLAEFIVLPKFLDKIPLRYHGYLSDRVWLLAQSSKGRVIPQNYVALVGDSYAQGAGDWLLSSDPWKNPDYSSAHVLYHLLNRDVISFGRGNSGSLRGIAALPVSRFAYLNKTWRYKIPPPSAILVYFYEGNDLTDNLEELHYYFPTASIREIRDSAAFQSLIRRASLRGQAIKPVDNLFFLRFLIRLVAEAQRKGRDEESQETPLSAGLNQALIQGKPMPLPNRLQAPALELNEEEIDLALHVFDESLRFLLRSFRGAKVSVVYIPSPLSCYEIVSKTVSIQSSPGRPRSYPASLIQERSNEIAGRVKAIADSMGLPFLDTRPSLKKAATDKLIHGPKDWKHFNETGYEILGREIGRLFSESLRKAAAK
jgi:hypothetical protein